jgi:hypothetical protein
MRIRFLGAMGALASLLTFAPGALSSVSASAVAKSENAVVTSVKAATFSLAAVRTTSDVNPQAALVVALANGAMRGQLFYLKNFGNLTINAFTLSQTFTSGPSGVAITYCDTSPFTFLDTTTCTSGSPTTALTGTSGSSALVSITITASTTRQFSMRAISNRTTTETLGVSVARSGARAATVTNS